MDKLGLIIFYTTSSAIMAEKILSAQGLYVKLIPTPRQFSSDCGVALSFDATLKDHISSIIENNGIEISSIELT